MKHRTKFDSITPALIAACLVVLAVCVEGQSSINFANNSGCQIINGITGNPVGAQDGFQAALFYAPLGFPAPAFSQSGPAVIVGKPVPGIFAGGTRLTDTGIAPGDSVQVQVRAWPAAFATYQDAVNSGAAVGLSSILVITTGDAGAQPLVPPPSLTVDGLQGFTINGLWDHPPLTTNIVLTTPANTPLSIDTATIFAATSDPDGDNVSIYSVDTNSAHNGSIAESGATIIYTPSTNFQGNDTFSVRVTDGRGGFAAVPVSVLVSGSWTPVVNELSINCVNGHTAISFAGAPGENYVIQYGATVNGPWTDLSGSLTIGANLTMGYNDRNPPATSRFYRVVTKQ
ncbi:MAG: cadherin-like domain-containing protein [Limisphaerales bacterium]